MPLDQTTVQRRLLLVTNVDITRNYGGNLVVLDAMRKCGWQVCVVGPFGEESSSVLRGRNFQVADTGIRNPTRNGRPPGRPTRYMRQAKALLRVVSSLKKADVVVCAEIQFSGFVALCRFMLRTNTRIIQSCGEFYARSDGVSWVREAQYRWSAKYWDGLIDVDRHRLERRKLQLNTTCPTLVVPNTLAAQPELRRRPATRDRRIPILAYVGTVNPNVDFGSMAASFRMVNHPFELVCVLFGPDQQVDLAKAELKSALAQQVSFVSAMSKAELASFLAANCDAGIVHYPPRAVKSFSQEYCAPGKMFDFLSIGLPIVTTANPPIQELIKQFNVGVAATVDSIAGFGLAVEEMISLLTTGQIDGEAIAACFDRHFSSEAFQTPVKELFDEVLRIKLD